MTESSKTADSGWRGYLTRVVVLYLGVSYAVLEIVDIFIDQLGLPDWFFPGIVVLLLLGLPIVVATGWVQSRGRRAEPGPLGAEVGEMPPPTREDPGEAAESRKVGARIGSGAWLTWRRAVVGFLAAFALWGLVVAAYMAMRVLGVGPVGSLVAAGVLDERDRIIVADFENHTNDSLLGQAATEAFRIDFSQSPMVTVVDPSFVDQALARMQRDPGGPLDLELAREVAIREGVKAIVAGEITPVGSRMVLSAQLVSAPDGRVLTAQRETARDSTEIIGAIDKLSNKLRERLGESLKTIRGGEPLHRVTTPSLEALRKYSLAVSADDEGDNERAIALLEEAVQLDTAFAMAWRKLGVILGNLGTDRAREVEALTKAYEHRDRLTDRERYLTIGSYHMGVTRDNTRAIAAYQSLLEVSPNDGWAMNNLAILYERVRDFRQANQLFERAIELDSAGSLYYGNAVSSQVALGDYATAEETLRRFRRRFPNHPSVAMTAAALAASQFEYEAAEREVRALQEAQRSSALWQIGTGFTLAQLAEVRGQLNAAENRLREVRQLAEAQGNTTMAFNAVVRIVFHDILLRGDREGARERLVALLDDYPVSGFQPAERPYLLVALSYALLGEPEAARRYVAEYETEIDPAFQDDGLGGLDFALGVIALAEGSTEEAIRHFRVADRGSCPICILPLLGQAYDAAGEPDSVISVYERYVQTPWLDRAEPDWFALAGIYERLGGLYELRGEPERASLYYGRFIELWNAADDDLQPRVEAARRAVERLSGEATG